MNEKVQSIIDGYRNAAALLPIIRRICLQFDGKVFNKRMREALREAVKSETGLNLCWDTYREYSKGQCAYVYNGGRYCSQHTVLQVVLNDEKRLDAAKSIEDAAKKREKLLTEAAEIEEVESNMPQIREQLDYVEKLQRKLLDGIPYVLKDVYGLRKW